MHSITIVIRKDDDGSMPATVEVVTTECAGGVPFTEATGEAVEEGDGIGVRLTPYAASSGLGRGGLGMHDLMQCTAAAQRLAAVLVGGGS